MSEPYPPEHGRHEGGRPPNMPQRVPHQYVPGTNQYDRYDGPQALPPAPIPQPQFTPNSGMPAQDVNSPAGAPGYENAPAHYKTAAGIQPFDVWDAYIGDWRIYAMTGFKYLVRWNKKGSAKNDLQKAVHMLLEAFNRAPRETEDFLNVEELTLKPEDIVNAFELQGLIRDAVTDLLLAFTTPHPSTYLRAALSEVQEFFQGM